MTIRVLIVDDSGFFRRRIADLIGGDPRMEVVGTANNGREGVDKAAELRPDVITMDYEMPVLDGISAVREIMRTRPAPVLMFSSLTYEGARVTLDALEAGAVDFLPKNFEEISRSPDEVRRTLCDRIVTVAGSAHSEAQPVAAPEPPRSPARGEPAERKPAAAAGRYKLLVIGASTGGPMALQQLLTTLPASFPVPIVLVQHMPGSFTSAFAERLDRLCAIGVSEARDSDVLEPGRACLIPGGRQGLIENRSRPRLRVTDGDERLHYKPSVDVTLGSAANAMGNRVLAVILTGMGADGREGGRLLKERGGDLWAQDQASSVIYGMPMAVARAGLTDRVLALDAIGPKLVQEVR